jgi:hypothetical protein
MAHTDACRKSLGFFFHTPIHSTLLMHPFPRSKTQLISRWKNSPAIPCSFANMTLAAAYWPPVQYRFKFIQPLNFITYLDNNGQVTLLLSHSSFFFRFPFFFVSVV